MRLILFSTLFILFGCGDGFDAPPFTRRAESEIKDCEISGIEEEREGEIWIRTISELEALHDQPCGNYQGTIHIYVGGIENLKGLQNLRRVTGLAISSKDLRTLEGIEELEITGTRSLFIDRNPELTSIAALNAPEALTLTSDNPRQHIWLRISDNPKLESLRGLENFRNLEQARVNISYNASLKNLEGLNNIHTIGFAKFQGNYGLESLDGLESVESGGSLVLLDHTILTNINYALPRLKSLDILSVEGNDNISPCEVEAISERVEIGEVFASDNGGTKPCE